MGSIRSPKIYLDGDEFVFKAASVCEEEVRWDDQNHVLYSNENDVWDTFQKMVKKVEEVLDSIYVIVCFSGKRPYFREDLGTYKTQRDGRKPLCYRTTVAKIGLNYPIKRIDGLEADDVMGIYATQNDGIIVSSDKDMKTINARIYNPMQKTLESISGSQAVYNHFYQTLVGDASDGYKGAPGVGPAKAAKLLEEACTWQAVVEGFKGDEEAALTQARMAKILDKNLYINEKVILWNPT